MTSSATTIRIAELAYRLGTTESFVREMAVAELIQIDEREAVSVEDAERVRLSWLLIQELEVNLAGVEVILHMRESMLSMQRQFALVLSEIAAAAKASKS